MSGEHIDPLTLLGITLKDATVVAFDPSNPSPQHKNVSHEHLHQSLFQAVRERFRHLEATQGLTVNDVADRLCWSLTDTEKRLGGKTYMSFRQYAELFLALECTPVIGTNPIGDE